MRSSFMLRCVFPLVFSPLLAFSTTYYVNGTTGNDSWDGLAAAWDGTHGPKQTIQAGVDAAADTDEVVVADGTYTGAGNRDIEFFGKAITVRSENGAQNCIIDCEGTEAEPHRGFYFGSGESESSVLRDSQFETVSKHTGEGFGAMRISS